MQSKAKLINRILTAVNDNAKVKGGRKADGKLFFTLAFMSVKELKLIINQAGLQ